jgi:outer membrane protein OmpA-like peptidoglycan-associated protein
MTDGSQGGGGAGTTSFAAQHPAAPPQKLNVAPTDGTSRFNAIRIPLIPVACWRLNDPAFAFDSSFVSPNFKSELTTLSGIVAANPACPAALFGHCDPAGTDALNKTLGDRRAMAIYALVTRQPDLWAYLYDHTQVGDTWDLRMVQTMLANVPDGQGDPYYTGPANGVRDSKTIDAVKRFQADAGVAVDGDPGKDTRKALFGAYMDWLCTAGSTAPPSSDPGGLAASSPAPFRMQPTDFLGGAGAQPGDLPKMSLQSCGKFNPIVLLTTAEMGGEDTTGGASKTQRNADDAPNRRVIMFLFKKGTTVDPAVWPCPKVKEPNDACKSAFWPDGDTRRQNGDEEREYKITRDTMACRFYDRFARRSPCEGAPGKMLDVIIRVIVDGTGTPLPPRPFTLTAHGATASDVPFDIDSSGTTDDQGFVRAKVPQGTTTGTLVVQFTDSDGTSADVWTIELDFQDLAEPDTAEGAWARLSNLGLQPGEDDSTLNAGTLRAVNRFKELFDFPVLCPPGPSDPPPDASTVLDSTMVQKLTALYEAQDVQPSNASSSSGSS